MTRQLWDEARHAMMGEVGFVANQVDWTQARITHNWSLRLNTECSPLERHAVLYFIEQGLDAQDRQEVMSGKSRPARAIRSDGDDPGLRLGRRSPSRRRSAASGTSPSSAPGKTPWPSAMQCWSKILSNWAEVRDKGLTEHANWWPAIYLQACRGMGHRA